jgi:hypothetical protein
MKMWFNILRGEAFWDYDCCFYVHTLVEVILKCWTNTHLQTGRHDTQYNNIQYNDTQHKGIVFDTWHKSHSE